MFEILLAEKQQKEMITALRHITDELKKKKDTGVEDAVKLQSRKIEGFIEAIRAIEIPAPIVNLETKESVLDVSGISEAIKVQTDSILKSLTEIKKELNKPLEEWEFKINRNKEGYIESVNANQTK